MIPAPFLAVRTLRPTVAKCNPQPWRTVLLHLRYCSAGSSCPSAPAKGKENDHGYQQGQQGRNPHPGCNTFQHGGVGHRVEAHRHRTIQLVSQRDHTAQLTLDSTLLSRVEGEGAQRKSGAIDHGRNGSRNRHAHRAADLA